MTLALKRFAVGFTFAVLFIAVWAGAIAAVVFLAVAPFIISPWFIVGYFCAAIGIGEMYDPIITPLIRKRWETSHEAT